VNFYKILANNLYGKENNRISFIKIMITGQSIQKFYNRHDELNSTENLVIETDYVKF